MDKRRPRRLTGGLLNLSLVLVTLGALAFVLPALFGMERYVITGRSMTGTYDLGSIVYEEKVPVSDLRVGDVITYVPPTESGIDHLVTHRIVSIHGKTFQTRGDAVGHDDPWTFELTAAAQPRVTFAVPYAGYPLIALQDRETRMLAIGVPAGVIFLFALGDLVGLLRRGTRSASMPVRGEPA